MPARDMEQKKVIKKGDLKRGEPSPTPRWGFGSSNCLVPNKWWSEMYGMPACGGVLARRPRLRMMMRTTAPTVMAQSDESQRSIAARGLWHTDVQLYIITGLGCCVENVKDQLHKLNKLMNAEWAKGGLKKWRDGKCLKNYSCHNVW